MTEPLSPEVLAEGRRVIADRLRYIDGWCGSDKLANDWLREHELALLDAAERYAGQPTASAEEALRSLIRTQGIEGTLCQIAREIKAQEIYAPPNSPLGRFMEGDFGPDVVRTP